MSLRRTSRFFKLFICTLLVCIGSIVLLSYLVDPLWCFTHANRWNSRQISFNERQQKSNFLAVRNNNYDILMLGSSRTTFLAADDIGGDRAYNFAVNAMMPDEYSEYAAFFRKHNQYPPAVIVIGLDFYATNGNFHGYGYLNPDEYFSNAESRLWRYSTLVSLDALNYSIRNIRQTMRVSKPDYYDRMGVKNATAVPKESKRHFIAKDVAMFRRDFYGSNYRYRDLKAVYREFLNENSASRLIVFTTPDSLPLWKLLLSEGRLEDYIRWIGDIVEVFGEVHDFMGENNFTSNPDNYMDGHHFYPQAGKILANSIMNSSAGLLGTVVAINNFPAYAAELRARHHDLKR